MIFVGLKSVNFTRSAIDLEIVAIAKVLNVSVASLFKDSSELCQLIRTHAQGSYEILKNIDFNAPIAEIVLQHHERIDGSGYPNKLKGSEILLEAKILAVADVVEAMVSHRPYRAAQGVDRAIDEISGNKKRLYDPVVADTCVRLFLEKGVGFTE